MDIDAKDTRMAVYVDDVLRGVTPEFEVDKGSDCGANVGLCLATHHSGGVVNIPPGKHRVRIEWIGNGLFVDESSALLSLFTMSPFMTDFLPNTKNIDWGSRRERRIMWQREYCGQIL
jgi:hypothetical protein